MKTKLLLISIFLITPLVGFSHVVSGKVVDINLKILSSLLLYGLRVQV